MIHQIRRALGYGLHFKMKKILGEIMFPLYTSKQLLNEMIRCIVISD